MVLSTNKLGRSGMSLTEMGFGGAPLGGVGQRASEDQAMEILREAYESGIRYFDTAPLYGKGLSEKRIGKFLNTVSRDSFVISTKVGRLLVPKDEGQRDQMIHHDESKSIIYDYSYEGAKTSLEASISRLGIDHVDLLLCHDIDE